MSLYFTPAAISYLTQLILAALISGYFLTLARRRPNPAHLYWLTGTWLGLTGFIAALFLGAALAPPTSAVTAVFLQIPLLAGSWMCMLQFAYHFPTLPAAARGEARGVLALSGLYWLWEVGYAVFRFVRLAAGVVEYRIDWTDALLLLLLLWTPVVFVRQLFWQTPAAMPQGQRLRALCRCPLTREQRALGRFTLIFLLVAGLSGLNLLRTYYLLPVALANVGIAAGILLALAAFALTYLNQRPELTSFMVKLAGITLTVMLAILGVVGWVVAPTHSAAYQPDWPAGRALRFTPNAGGGYDVAAIPYAFETALGRDLALDDGLHRGCSEALPFAFPFYGQDFHAIYVCNDGVIALGQAVRYREFQYRYGAGVPLLLPLPLDLDPTISPGGVFARQTADRLIVTWDRLRAFRQPEAEFTFQAVLYADGRCDFIYKALPDTLAFQPNDAPGASLWAVGALPGDRRGPAPQQVTLRALPVSGGPAGLIQDFRLEFRRHLHRLLAPLAALILAASALIVGGFPWLFYANLVGPLNALLAGVRRIEAGDYAAAAPVQFPDEIGFLTRAFNTLSAELGALIYTLETRVAARTADLDVANVQLRAEITEREHVQATAVAQQRALAAAEEREGFSRELHDGLGQLLGFMNVQVQAVETLLEQKQLEPAQVNLRQLRVAVQEAHTDVRNFILSLRADTRQPSQTLWDALRARLTQFQATYAIDTYLSLPAHDPLPEFNPAIEAQLLHILQEALTNVHKHARARRVEVQVHLTPAAVHMLIRDDGVGFAMSDAGSPILESSAPQSADSPNPQSPISNHFGLAMMQERAAAIGGTLEDTVGELAQWRVSLPLRSRILLSSLGRFPGFSVWRGGLAG